MFPSGGVALEIRGTDFHGIQSAFLYISSVNRTNRVRRGSNFEKRTVSSACLYVHNICIYLFKFFSAGIFKLFWPWAPYGNFYIMLTPVMQNFRPRGSLGVSCLTN